MANDLTKIDRLATDCSTPALMASAKDVLDRAFDPTATFTVSEITLVQRIAAVVPASIVADETYIRRAIGSLAGALPSQATSAEGGALKLKTYQTMLAGCDERALAYACRRCLDELDWMPTVHQLKERMAAWVSPEQAAVTRARAIVRMGRRADEGGDPQTITAEEMSELRERVEQATVSLVRQRPEPVSYATAGPLEPHQLRIPNKGDYERLFGIDPDAVAAKAAKARADDEERDRDLLLAVYEQQAAIARIAE